MDTESIGYYWVNRLILDICDYNFNFDKQVITVRHKKSKTIDGYGV